MACESCKVVVKDALEELDISPVKVELGEIEKKEDLTDEEKMELNLKIKKAGLELLEKKQGVLVEKIRKVIIDYVYKSDEKPNVKFSALLSEELNHSYTYLYTTNNAVFFNSLLDYFFNTAAVDFVTRFNVNRDSNCALGRIVIHSFAWQIF